MRNRLRLILLGVFCAGVLFTGIGVGIAIVEYTSLEYTGVHIMSGDMKKSEYEFKIALKEEEKLRVMNWQGVTEIVYDKTVPVNTIRCSALYDSGMLEMMPQIVENGNNPWLYFNRKYTGSGFDLLMQHKDLILADLKAGKIGTYRVEEPIQEIIVTVNPQMKDVILLEGW